MRFRAHHLTSFCLIGIGRVTKGLLLPLGITQCDLVEPSPRLISSAPDYLGDESAKCRYFCKGLQDFEPMEQTYDIIWIQWVIGYLTDDDLVDFLKRCAAGLRRGGVVVIKDNTCEQEAFIVDRDDASSTRSFPYILAVAELAGFRVVYQRFQENFPANIFPVPILALEPRVCGGAIK
jgi:protein N-terminal methyltransferase